VDNAVVTAMAAALGSLVGASGSIVTTWISQRAQSTRANVEWKLRERESLYKDFIMEASRLSADAMMSSLERPDQLVVLYGILSRIRLVSGDDVLGKATGCCRRIVELYKRPNMTPEQLRAAFESFQFDPLNDFSAACRAELLAMAATA
jgi:hypothetical protein